jgi:transposase-like protein
VTAVRWYGRFRLSLRDVCDLLAERGVDVSPRTVLSWVHTFGPLLAAAPLARHPLAAPVSVAESLLPDRPTRTTAEP